MERKGDTPVLPEKMNDKAVVDNQSKNAMMCCSVANNETLTRMKQDREDWTMPLHSKVDDS